MSVVSVKWPDWGSGFRAGAVLPCADFSQASSLGSDRVVDDLVCPGGVYKCVFSGKVAYFKIIENKNKINPWRDKIMRGAVGISRRPR